MDGAAAARYLVKLSLVPEESERCTVSMAVDGRLAPEFSALISGSFHLVICPEKILAMVSGFNWRSLTPRTL